MNTFQISATIQAYSYDELPEDYRELVDIAKEMTKAAYSPYSRFSVGAALRLADGTIVRGCNQENAAYPVGLCAERTAIFAAGVQYPDVPVKALAIAARTPGGQLQDEPVSPCGSCRQVLIETETRFHQPVRILLYGTKKVYVIDGISNLMPLSFTEF